MHADIRMNSEAAKINVTFFLGKVNSFVSSHFIFIFAFSSFGLPNFLPELGPDPPFFPCSWTKHNIVEFLVVSASLSTRVVCLSAVSLRHKSSHCLCSPELVCLTSTTCNNPVCQTAPEGSEMSLCRVLLYL